MKKAHIPLTSNTPHNKTAYLKEKCQNYPVGPKGASDQKVAWDKKFLEFDISGVLLNSFTANRQTD